MVEADDSDSSWSWRSGTYDDESTDTSPSIPTSLSDLVGADTAATLTSFGKAPGNFVRGIIYNELLRGLAVPIFSLFGAIVWLLFGSDPGQFASYAEINGIDGAQLGLVDMVAYFFQSIGNFIGFVLTTYFDTLEFVIESAAPGLPGPADGVITIAVSAVALLVLVITTKRFLLATMEAIPIVGGPLKTLLTGK